MRLTRSNFNPRTRVGCDDWIYAYLLRRDNISIHAPAWGATGRSMAETSGAEISIHAPAWGATNFTYNTDYLLDISIHAPAWGATGLSRCIKPPYSNISIHAPAWGATLTEPKPVQGLIISIHAPAWGATRIHPLFFGLYLPFQSTHPHGVRPCEGRTDFFTRRFQSTHPHGVRRGQN